MTIRYKNSAAGLLLAAYLAIPLSLWALSSSFSSDPSTLLRLFGQACGIAGACLFSLNFILAARISWIEKLLRGLPRLYNLHHLFGGLALILLLAHPVLLGLQYLSQSVTAAAAFYVPSLSKVPELLGGLALTTIVSLLFITFYVRIAYHKWKSTHQWLGLALLFASLHVYLIPGNLSQASGLRLYMVTVILAGLAAYGYRVVFGRWLVRRTAYRVAEIIVHPGATEVSLSPVSKPIRYRAGQFLFVSVRDSKGVTLEPHPFSFTSAPVSRDISFAAKSLGDYTETLKLLKTGDSVQVEGPYGQFIFEETQVPQVWIAGGIGVTPFMSRARQIRGKNGIPITFYYVVRNKSDTLFLDELTGISKDTDTFKLIVWESGTQGRFSVADIAQAGTGAGQEFFICGPVRMIADLKRDLKQAGVGRQAIHAEEFKLY